MMKDSASTTRQTNNIDSTEFNLHDNILLEVHEKQLENSLKSFMEADRVHQQIVNAGKHKIEQQFQERRRGIETAAKIHRSSLINQHHMMVASLRHGMCEEIFEAVLQRIRDRIEEDEDEYCLTLIKLIVEGALRMFEPELQVKCLPQHRSIVARVLESAQLTFNAVMQEETGRAYPISIKLHPTDSLQMRLLDEKQKESFSKNREDTECIGGVILSDRTGDITYKNTIDTRVNILREICLPIIRTALWPSLQRDTAS